MQRSKRNVAKNSKTLIKNKESPVAHEVESVMKNTELTDKQQLFCIYYIRCFNATKAYQKAYGCNYTTAMSEGSKHLRNPKIKEEIFRLKQERLNREFLSESDIFQKYMDIAFADITDYVEFGNGSFNDPETGEEDVRKASDDEPFWHHCFRGIKRERRGQDKTCRPNESVAVAYGSHGPCHR